MSNPRSSDVWRVNDHYDLTTEVPCHPCHEGFLIHNFSDKAESGPTVLVKPVLQVLEVTRVYGLSCNPTYRVSV